MASCDVTFAMLSDPESAVRMFSSWVFHFLTLYCNCSDLYITLCQFDVACGKHGAASGISSGKGYFFTCVSNEYELFISKALGSIVLVEDNTDTVLIKTPNILI